MRAIIQRVSQAAVTVDSKTVGELSAPGVMVLLGISQQDTEAESSMVAKKLFGLRILENEESLESTGAGALVVSQFTLYGDVRKGRRPSWSKAAPPAQAEPLYEHFVGELRSLGVPVETGVFGAMMDVSLVNSGPFTVMIDSDELKRPKRS